ncbi:MAG: recombination regulator RecX [Candidatus Bipolaricaulota bacterium]|nr:recombination regulator RecX [Candidatus Bipolaricaulota bacterium]MCX7844149.1 recombination regulator RecX [Candidatus Bipolaricaulota bacterium]MDW8152262.1 regulatory protein RecX [Candidatus Bipolaricaulota bacterium]
MREEERAWSYALRLLSLRPRAREELRQRLLRRGFSREVVERVLRRAEEAALVDDRAFALLYAEDRLLSRPCPRRRIAGELRARGVEGALAEEAAQAVLPELSEEELARRALASRRRLWEGLPPPVALRRAYAFLLRRGFPPELARRAAEEAFGPWTSASE